MQRGILAVMLALWSMAAHAAPSVFVKSQPNDPWWNGTINARITGKAGGPVSAEKLTAYIEETLVFGPYEICALEAVQSDTFIGVDHATQASIEIYRPDSIWRTESVTPGGRRIVAQSVLFESCGDEGPRGAALLVTDAATGEILRWVPAGSYTDRSGREIPIWVLFIDPQEDGGDELFSTALCRECGGATSYYYDERRRHIYYEYNGH